MPENASQGDYFNSLIDSEIRESISDLDLNLYTYMTSQDFGNWKLYPVQEVIVKVIAGIPLDNKDKNKVVIKDAFFEKDLYKFSEVEFCKYAFEEGRLSFKDQPDPVGIRWLMCLGRRSFKSALAGAVHAFQFLKFLKIENPFEYYGMREATKIISGIFSTSLEQSGIIYNEFMQDALRIEAFKSYNPKILTKYTAFKHPLLVKKQGALRTRPTYIVRPYASNAKMGLGFSMYCVTFDEFGNYITEEGGMSPEQIDNKISPTLSTFGNDAFWMAMSNATESKKTYWYKICDKALESPGEPYHVFRFPSWWVNLNPKYVPERRRAYAANKESFKVEYGTEFGFVGHRWKEPSLVEACVTDNLVKRSRYFFLGLDSAFTGDSCAATLISPTSGNKCSVIEHVSLRVGEGKYSNAEIVPLEDFIDIILSWYRKYNFQYAMADHHEIMTLITNIPGYILKHVHDVHFTNKLNYVCNSMLGEWLTKQGVVIPSKYPELIDSIKGLVKVERGQMKKITAASGEKDDPSDSLARAIMAFVVFCRKVPGLVDSIGHDFTMYSSYNSYISMLEDVLVDPSSGKFQKSKISRYQQTVGMGSGMPQSNNLIQQSFNNSRGRGIFTGTPRRPSWR